MNKFFQHFRFFVPAAAIVAGAVAAMPAPAAADAPDDMSPEVAKLYRQCAKAIAKVYPDKDDPERGKEMSDLDGIAGWTHETEDVKVGVLEEKLDRLTMLAFRDTDSDGDGLADYPDDGMPAIALSPIYWSVESMWLAWSADSLRAAAAASNEPLDSSFAERPVRAEFDRACRVTLFDRASWQGERAGRASAASVHPLYVLRANGAEQAALVRGFSLFGTGDIGWNAISARRAAQAHGVARRVSAVDGEAHTELRFTLRLMNLSLQQMRCRSLEVPVEVGGTTIGVAKPVGAGMLEHGFVVPPNDSNGVVVEFCFRLDAGRLARAWLAAEEPLAPRVAFEMCRGRIEVGDGGGSADVTTILRNIVASTVPFTVDGGDGLKLVWRVAPKACGQVTRVTDVFADLNGVAAKLDPSGDPVLAGKAGWPRSLASWDNGSYGLWWHVSVGGRDVGGADWTESPVKGGVSFSRGSELPRLAMGVMDEVDDDVVDPGLDFLRATIAMEAGEDDDAEEFFLRAAEADFAPAQTWSGYLYVQRGLRDAAARWFRRAAELGYAPGETWLGTISKADAASCFRRAADAGQAEAQTRLGVAISKGGGRDSAFEAETLLRAAAAQDYPSAQVALGRLLSSSGKEEDLAEAMYWFGNSARNGSASGQTMLAMAMQGGIGTAKDPKGAALWLELAANQGYALAQTEFGKCFFAGRGVPKRAKTAVEWFGKAAEQGNPEGMFWLGLCKLRGAGTRQDAVHGAGLVADAADGGMPLAQFLHGMLLLRGANGVADAPAAVARFRQAAEKGVPAAQVWLGYCLATGTGVEKDAAAAREWFDKAAAQGVDVSAYREALE